MAAATPQPFPVSPIYPHLAGILGTAGVVAGIGALVLMLCTLTTDIPGAPMGFTAILAAFFGLSGVIVACAQRIIHHQQVCYEANRAASKSEIAGALKKVHKDVEAIRQQWKAAEVARVTAAIVEQEQPSRFGLINGGGSGLG